MNEKVIKELKRFRDQRKWEKFHTNENLAKAINIEAGEQRKWEKFHTNENLAKAINIEAGELLELFLWDETFNKDELEDEIADIVSYLTLLADKNNINIEEAVLNKIEKNKKSFPKETNQGEVNKHE